MSGCLGMAVDLQSVSHTLCDVTSVLWYITCSFSPCDITCTLSQGTRRTLHSVLVCRWKGSITG